MRGVGGGWMVGGGLGSTALVIMLPSNAGGTIVILSYAHMHNIKHGSLNCRDVTFRE